MFYIFITCKINHCQQLTSIEKARLVLDPVKYNFSASILSLFTSKIFLDFLKSFPSLIDTKKSFHCILKRFINKIWSRWIDVTVQLVCRFFALPLSESVYHRRLVLTASEAVSLAGWRPFQIHATLEFCNVISLRPL